MFCLTKSSIRCDFLKIIENYLTKEELKIQEIQDKIKISKLSKNKLFS